MGHFVYTLKKVIWFIFILATGSHKIAHFYLIIINHFLFNVMRTSQRVLLVNYCVHGSFYLTSIFTEEDTAKKLQLGTAFWENYYNNYTDPRPLTVFEGTSAGI